MIASSRYAAITIGATIPTTIATTMKKAASGIPPLIAIDRKAPKALHRQIYEAYRQAIVVGSLRPGQRVLSSRALASELGLSRFPVLNAYAQLLAEGYFESRVGAGTVASSSIPDEVMSSGPIGPASSSTRSGPRSGPRPLARRASILSPVESSPWLRGWGAFGVGQVAFDRFPLQIWSNLVARRSRNMDARSFHYGDQGSTGNDRDVSENRAIFALRSGTDHDRQRLSTGAGDFSSLSSRPWEPGVGGRARISICARCLRADRLCPGAGSG